MTPEEVRKEIEQHLGCFLCHSIIMRSKSFYIKILIINIIYNVTLLIKNIFQHMKTIKVSICYFFNKYIVFVIIIIF